MIRPQQLAKYVLLTRVSVLRKHSTLYWWKYRWGRGDGVLSMAECGCQDIIYDMLDHGPLLITYLESGALPVPWVR